MARSPFSCFYLSPVSVNLQEGMFHFIPVERKLEFALDREDSLGHKNVICKYSHIYRQQNKSIIDTPTAPIKR